MSLPPILITAERQVEALVRGCLEGGRIRRVLPMQVPFATCHLDGVSMSESVHMPTMLVFKVELHFANIESTSRFSILVLHNKLVAQHEALSNTPEPSFAVAINSLIVSQQVLQRPDWLNLLNLRLTRLLFFSRVNFHSLLANILVFLTLIKLRQ